MGKCLPRCAVIRRHGRLAAAARAGAGVNLVCASCPRGAESLLLGGQRRDGRGRSPGRVWREQGATLGRCFCLFPARGPPVVRQLSPGPPLQLRRLFGSSPSTQHETIAGDVVTQFADQQLDALQASRQQVRGR